MTFVFVFIITLMQNVLNFPKKYGNDNGKLQPVIASGIGFVLMIIVFSYNPHLF